MHKPLLEEYIKAWELYAKSDSPLDLDYVRHLHYKMEKEIDQEYEKHSTELKTARNLVRSLLNKFADSNEKSIPYQAMLQNIKNKPQEWQVVESKGSWGSPMVQKVKDKQNRTWSKSMLSGNFEIDT